MSPLRIIDYIMLLVLIVGFGYLQATSKLHWSYVAGIILPLIVIVLLIVEDRMK